MATHKHISAPATTASERVSFEILIIPSQGWIRLRLGELWEYRELLYFLTWRDIKVRYKQTILGAAWAILQPLLTMIVFSIFFGRLAGMPSDGVPYPVFSYAALVPWQLFASGMSQAAVSLVSDARLITKIYFPRLALPIANVFSALVDFGLAFMLLLLLQVGYGLLPTMRLFWLPLFLLLGLAVALGAGLWLAALNVQFRDVRYTLPFLTQLWLFLTPVAYPSSLLSPPWRLLYSANPMVGVVEGFRWALLGAPIDLWPGIGISTAAALLLLVSGAYYFRRMEKYFADLV